MVETVLRLRGWQYLDADLYRTVLRIHQRYLLLQVSADSFRHIGYAINFLVDKLIYEKVFRITPLRCYHTFAFCRFVRDTTVERIFHIINDFKRF